MGAEQRLESEAMLGLEMVSRATVLNRRPEGEADRQVVLFTPGYGKLLAKATGAARSKSRLGPILEPLCEVEVRLIRRRENQEVFRLINATLIDDRAGLKGNLSRLAFAMLVVETVEACCPYHDPHPEIHAILQQCLQRLETTRQLWGWALASQLEILAPLGLFPLLSACAVCGGTVESDPVPLASEAGGIVCGGCAAGRTFEVMLPRRILEKLEETPVGQDLDLTPEEGQTVERFLKKYLEYHLEWEFKSLEFIAALKRGV